MSLMRSKPSASLSSSSASSRALLLPRRLKSSVAQASTRLIDHGSELGSVTGGVACSEARSGSYPPLEPNSSKIRANPCLVWVELPARKRTLPPDFLGRSARVGSVIFAQALTRARKPKNVSLARGSVHAGGRQAGDFRAGLRRRRQRWVWERRRSVERERISGPDELGLGVEATFGRQHGAAVLPLPPPAGPVPIAVAPDAAARGAMRNADLFDFRGRRRIVDFDRRGLCRLRPSRDGHEVRASAARERAGQQRAFEASVAHENNACTMTSPNSRYSTVASAKKGPNAKRALPKPASGSKASGSRAISRSSSARASPSLLSSSACSSRRSRTTASGSSMRPRATNTASATSVACTAPASSANTAPCQPNQAPASITSLASPSPIPGKPRSLLYRKSNGSQTSRKPTAAPKSASWKVPPRSGTLRRPSSAPPIVIGSGRYM